VKLPAALALGVALLFSSGCAYTRITTTDKTAIEQALMSQSIAPSIDTIRAGHLAGRSFWLDASEVQSPAKDYIVSRIRQRLLLDGLTIAKSQDEADLLLHARTEFSGIDDSNFLLGLPAIPIPIGASTLSLPELALYKRERQAGRNQIALYGVERETGALGFESLGEPGQQRYTRYTFLIFFNLRTTTLPQPF
jgi:hypothetical protein